MSLATVTVRPSANPKLAAAGVVPLNIETRDRVLGALRPDHWFFPSNWADGVWYDDGLGDRTQQSVGATPPALATLSGKSYLNFQNTSALTAGDQGPLIEAVAEFSIVIVRHPNGGTDNDPIIGPPADVTPDANNRYLRIDANYNSGPEIYGLSVVGSTNTAIPLLVGGVARNFDRSVPHLILVTYSAALGWRFRVDSGSSLDVQLASPSTAQTVSVGRMQIGRNGSTNGVAAHMYGGLGDVMTFSRDLRKPANAADLAALTTQLMSDWNIAA